MMCQAHQTQTVDRYPEKRRKKSLPEKTRWFLMLSDQSNRVFMEKFSGTGVWEGLWGVPQFDDEHAMIQWLEKGQLNPCDLVIWPRFRHTFSHFHLHIQPIALKAIEPLNYPRFSSGHWHSIDAAMNLGIPTPIKQLLGKLASA
jgi:A/G-specific adenine glycosylase